MDSAKLDTTFKTENKLGLGLGFRHCHADEILAGKSSVDWFEVISENYLDSGGKSKYVLQQLAERYPLVCHGVSMSIGSTDPLNFEYLKKLKRLAKDIQPRWVSDHLCWTGVMGANSHDLLPVPLNETTLHHIVKRVRTVQDFLERPIVLENPSTYMTFQQSTIDEPTFLRTLAEQTGCQLLLDVNNVYVTAFNCGIAPLNYLERFPFEYVTQMHLAGHEDCGTHIVDTHDQPVHNEVWELFQLCWQKTGGVATCLEWDGNIPSLQQCEQELHKARGYQNPSKLSHRTADFAPQTRTGATAISTPISFMLPNVMENTSGKAN